MMNIKILSIRINQQTLFNLEYVRMKHYKKVGRYIDTSKLMRILIEDEYNRLKSNKSIENKTSIDAHFQKLAKMPNGLINFPYFLQKKYGWKLKLKQNKQKLTKKQKRKTQIKKSPLKQNQTPLYLKNRPLIIVSKSQLMSDHEKQIQTEEKRIMGSIIRKKNKK